jgi:hypothetical protein
MDEFTRPVREAAERGKLEPSCGLGVAEPEKEMRETEEREFHNVTGFPCWPGEFLEGGVG